MPEIKNDSESVSGGMDGVRGRLDSNMAGADGNVDPAVRSALEDGNRSTGDDIDGAGEDADRAKRASLDLDDTEGDNARKASSIGTDLSADGMGGGGGSPMLGGGMPQQPMPQAMPPPAMPPMQPPQMAQMSPANFKMPQESLNKLLSGYSPKEGSTRGGDLGRATPSGVSGADAIDVSQVRYDKTGIGPLTNSEMRAVIEEALDKNGISKDPSVRAQWHEVLTFMAEKESSRNPDAVNLTDTNAIGAPAADGHPGQSSRGIWQTIPSTFAAYHVANTSTNIYDPTASASAAINYIQDRYNVSPNGGASLQAFYSRRMSGGYTGY